MKRRLLLLLVVLTLTGCATTVRYFSYTNQRFLPKSQDYFVTIYPEQQHPASSQSYVVIGKVDITGRISDDVTSEVLIQQAKVIARKKGADAIINVKTQNFTYNGIETIPGHVSYHAVAVGHRYREGVVYVEHYHPARYIPYSDTVLTFQGELIVFTAPSYSAEK